MHAGLPPAQPAQSPATPVAPAPSERPEQKAAEMQVPLICQQSFKNSLHCWDKLLDDRLFRNRLRSYCVVCGMWIADAKHLKQHFNKVHQATYPTALEDARQLCLPFKSHFTRNRSCRYCGSNVGAPCRHVLQCSVLHQLCLAVSLCQPSVSRQDNGLRSQLGNLCSLHAVGSTASIHVSGGGHATSETAAPGAGQAAWSHAGTHASAQAGLLDLQRAPSPVSPSVRDATIAAGEPRPTSQQDCSQTRRTTGSTEEGYPVRPLHETGRQVDPPGAGPGVAQEGRLASERHRLDLSAMGPQAKAPGRGRKPRTSASRRSRASPLSPPEGHNRRHRDQVQQHREPGQTGGGRIPASSLPPLRGSGATEVHEQLCKLVGSSLTHLAAFSMKKDDLLRPPQVKQLAQLTYGGGPSLPSPTCPPPASPSCHHRPPDPSLPRFALHNPQNHCYMNAFVYCVAILEQCTNHTALPPAFRNASDRPLDAFRAAGFSLLGWRRPQDQHDIAELIDFLAPRWCPFLSPHSWGGAQIRARWGSAAGWRQTCRVPFLQ